MRFDKFTTRFQQAIADAQSLAVGQDNPYIEPQHLLQALLQQDDGGTASLLSRAQLARFGDVAEISLAEWRTLVLVGTFGPLSVKELAKRAGSPGSARAAGAATGRNPLTIVVPCHRVVGSNGSLTGYAGGLERKRRLLEIEGA